MEFKLKVADTYYNNGSTWIILTDKKQWVIELTKDGTLWYNFYFFQSILAGLMGFEDTVKNQNYITEWVENFIQNGVKKTFGQKMKPILLGDIIKNGIKETWGYEKQSQMIVNEVIRGGIKETNWRKVDNHPTFLENILKK